MRAIDSFLNSEGGILIVGIADDKTIIGLKGDYSSLQEIARILTVLRIKSET